MFLSKTDFMMAEDCVKALWLKKNRKDVKEEIDAEDKKEQLESYAKKLAQSVGKSIQKTGVHGNTTSTPTTTK